MTGWSLPMPPVEVELLCQGTPHRLRWEDGHLVAADHEDPEGESLLAALGGDVAGCLEVVKSWNSHAGDARVLTLGPVSPLDVIAADEQVVAHVDDFIGNLAAHLGRRQARRGGAATGPRGAFPRLPGAQPPAAGGGPPVAQRSTGFVASGTASATQHAAFGPAPSSTPPPGSGPPSAVPLGGGASVAFTPPAPTPAAPTPPVAVPPATARPALSQLHTAGMRRIQLPGRPMASGRAAGVAIQALLSNAWTAGTDWRVTSELLHVLALERPLVDRLQLHVLVGRATDLRRALAGAGAGALPVRDGPALVAAGIARLRAAGCEWLAGAEEPDHREVVAELLPEGERLVVDQRSTPGVLRLTAGVGWLTGVWGRQLAVVDGYLVQEVLWVDAGGRAVVRALRPPTPGTPLPPRTVELVRRDGADAWTLASR